MTATERALRAMDEEQVFLDGVVPASRVCPDLDARTLLHAGPPIDPEEVGGPLLGALTGALLYEGAARTADEAERLVRTRAIALRPCHDAGAVGAAAGVVSRSMPVVVVRGAGGGAAFSPLNEGAGRALRFGCYDPETLAHLRWMADIAAPVLDDAARRAELELTSLVAESLRRGDEAHGRTVAGASLLVAALAPHVVDGGLPGASETLRWAGRNRHLFNTFAIAAGKAIADRGALVPSPLVSAIASNGVRAGIRVGACEGRWFTAPAPLGRPHLSPGFRTEDASPVLGDSFIAEVVGLGCAALAAAPASAAYFGLSPGRSAAIVARLRQTCAGVSGRFLVPAEDFAGTPLGIDVREVARRALAPIVSNAVAHRAAGVGQIGAGITELPLDPFLEAARELDRRSAAAGTAGA